MNDEDYDVVIDVLKKHIKVLSDMDRGESSFGIMTQIRWEQIGQIDKAIRIWNKYKDENL
jgi:hypothetical protein